MLIEKRKEFCGTPCISLSMIISLLLICYSSLHRCTRIYLPVCGADGLSYGNKCMAECSTRALPRCAGRCPCEERGGQGSEVAAGPGRFSEYFQQSQAPCSCNQRSRPVCGTDGQTYRSPCRAKCSTGGKFRRQCWGPCPCKTGTDAVKSCLTIDYTHLYFCR